MELTEQELPQEDEEVLSDLFDRWWELWPKGLKQNKKDAEKAWRKVFHKEPGIPREEWAHQTETVLMQGLKDQLAYRSRVFDKYPSQEDRKRADVFVPRLALPSTWLNGGRWGNPIPEMHEDAPKYRTDEPRCKHCDQESFTKVRDVEYCSWHWTRAFNKPHLRLLAEALESAGLGRNPEESREGWSDRCRQHLKGSRWGDALGA